MTFTLLDWSAIIAYLLITLLLGLYFRRSAGRSSEDYFVSGRNVSWWLAGTSMVATTFAADTPLLVAGLVYTQGISGNWIWWAFLPSGMMTVFLFARLWRRSGLMTDVQFAEMRYSGKPAAFLRGFRAIYLGVLMNCLILGWVTKAMINIVGTTLGVTISQWHFLQSMSRGLTATFRPSIFRHRWLRVDYLHFFPDSLHRFLCFAGRTLWRAVDRPVSIHSEDGHRHRDRLVRRESDWRDELADCADRRAARQKWRRRPARVSSRFFSGFCERNAVDAPGHYFLRLSRRAVVGLLVSGCGARWRRIHRAADFQRARRTSGIALRAVVQRGALRAAAVAVDSHRARGDRVVPRTCASGNQLHDDRQRPCAARFARHHRRGIPRRVHVHDRYAIELGHFVCRRRFLPPLSGAPCFRTPLCARFAGCYRAAGDRERLCFRAAGFDSFRMASCAGSGRREPAAFICCAGIGGASMRGAKFPR